MIPRFEPTNDPETLEALEKIHELLYFLIQSIDTSIDSEKTDVFHVNQDENL